MKTEIEAKYLSIDPNEIRKKLQDVGATCKQPMQLMRRVIFSSATMNEKHAFLRVRDEGHRITMTYKQFDDMSLTGAKEIECTVSDYDDAIALIEAAGIEMRSIQEARREVWTLGEIEVVLDEWPWIDPFLEIEAPTEMLVRDTAESLGLKWEDAAFGDVMTAYRAKYPNTAPDDAVYHLSRIRFEDPLPSILLA